MIILSDFGQNLEGFFRNMFSEVNVAHGRVMNVSDCEAMGLHYSLYQREMLGRQA